MTKGPKNLHAHIVDPSPGLLLGYGIKYTMTESPRLEVISGHSIAC
jgi:hypothetical protein